MDKILDMILVPLRTATSQVTGLLVVLALAIYVIAMVVKHRFGVIDDISELRNSLREELDAERRYTKSLKQDLMISRKNEETFKEYIREILFLYHMGKCESLKLRLEEIEHHFTCE